MPGGKDLSLMKYICTQGEGRQLPFLVPSQGSISTGFLYGGGLIDDYKKRQPVMEIRTDVDRWANVHSSTVLSRKKLNQEPVRPEEN